MKKNLLISLLAALCAISAAQAQPIRVGDRFYDGFAVYTVREIRMDSIVYMTDAIGDNELTLEKWGTAPGGVFRLRPSRNAILASHGYVFQSKDLKAYFEAQPWYTPAESNASVKLSLLEQLNVALIQAAERAE
ncbi:MAG: YARHG domain-containing protein [Bacteroidales bacterium]|nr:YARHG domain-containing protein [Bacteroidales bacterium]